MSAAVEPSRPPPPPSETAPFIRIQGVSKRFGPFLAVDNVSLDVLKGEMFSLLGASGCGKTTLLRLLAGFEQPTAGQIFLDGADMAGVPPYERPVNMVFQSYALFPHMTVEQNVAFGLKQDHVRSPELERRVVEVLELVELAPFTKRKPHQLSGGQRQRVALARSLVKRPKALLLDEPMAALDRKLREQTRFELVKIQKAVGITFILVTHDQEEAMTLSSRIAVMSRGRVVQVGTPSEIYESPNSRFTADFIGSINMFQGRVRANGAGHLIVSSEEAGGELAVDHSAALAPGSEVWVAVRPEKIEIGLTPPLPDANLTRGRVREVAYHGDSSIYLVELASHKVIKVHKANLVRTAERPLNPGDDVFVAWARASGLVLTS
ncbi:MAG: ABC transporter ATP-binding protein [Alphaproteobacteria bacterium]